MAWAEYGLGSRAGGEHSSTGQVIELASGMTCVRAVVGHRRDIHPLPAGLSTGPY